MKKRKAIKLNLYIPNRNIKEVEKLKKQLNKQDRSLSWFFIQQAKLYVHDKIKQD